jgi:hypothetical protein
MLSFLRDKLCTDGEAQGWCEVGVCALHCGMQLTIAKVACLPFEIVCSVDTPAVQLRMIEPACGCGYVHVLGADLTTNGYGRVSSGRVPSCHIEPKGRGLEGYV